MNKTTGKILGFFCAAWLSLLNITGCSAFDETTVLLQNVPESSRLVVLADWAAFQKTPFYAEIRETMRKSGCDPELYENQIPVKPEEVCSKFLIYSDLEEAWGLLLANPPKEAGLIESLKKDGDFTVAEKTVDGRKVYLCTGWSSIEKDRTTVVFCYLDARILLITDEDSLPYCFGAKGKTGLLTELFAKTQETAILRWAALPKIPEKLLRELDDAKKKSAKGAAEVELDEFIPKEISGFATFQGPEKRDFLLKAVLVCASPALRRAMLQKYQEGLGLLMILSAGIPGVGPELPKSLSLTEGPNNSLTFTLDLKASMIAAIRKAVEELSVPDEMSDEKASPASKVSAKKTPGA